MHALGGPEVGADARVGTPTNGLIIARLRNRTIAWRARSLANYVPNGRDRHRQYLSKLAHGVGATARMRRMTANLMLAMRATKRMGAQLSSISDSGVQMEQLLHFGDLYSPDAMCRRRALRDHAHVLEVMEAFWTTALRSNARDRQRQRLPPSTGVVLVSEARTDECCKHGALALPPKPPNKPLGIRARDLAAMRYARPCSYEMLRMPSRAGSPARTGYVLLFRRVYRLLIEHWDEHDATATVEEDWANDTSGSAAATLTREKFFDALFELADLQYVAEGSNAPWDDMLARTPPANPPSRLPPSPPRPTMSAAPFPPPLPTARCGGAVHWASPVRSTRPSCGASSTS